MELLSPARYTFPQRLHDYRMIVSGNSQITLDQFNFTTRYDLIYSEEGIVFSKQADGSTIGTLDPIPKPPPQEWQNIILKYQTMINICANTGEIVNRTLVELLDKAMNAKYIPAGVRPYELTKGTSTATMDFMSLRDEFSEFLKTDFIRSQSRFDSKSKRKSITSPFNQFVLDRNLYTHGRLHLEVPALRALMQSRDNRTRQLFYAEINPQILQSFSQFGTDLLAIFQLIEDLYPYQVTITRPAS